MTTASIKYSTFHEVLPFVSWHLLPYTAKNCPEKVFDSWWNSVFFLHLHLITKNLTQTLHKWKCLRVWVNIMRFPGIMSSANAWWGNEELGIRAHNFNSVFLNWQKPLEIICKSYCCIHYVLLMSSYPNYVFPKWGTHCGAICSHSLEATCAFSRPNVAKYACRGCLYILVLPDHSACLGKHIEVQNIC